MSDNTWCANRRVNWRALIRTRAVSPVEVLDAHLAAIERSTRNSMRS